MSLLLCTLNSEMPLSKQISGRIISDFMEGNFRSVAQPDIMLSDGIHSFFVLEKGSFSQAFVIAFLVVKCVNIM